MLEHRDDFEPPVVAVLSGGNIDPLLLSKVLRHGLSAAGRYLGFRCRLPDRPGCAGRAAARAGRPGRQRAGGRATSGSRRSLHVDEVEVVLQVETRGPEHCEEVITQLSGRATR